MLIPNIAKKTILLYSLHIIQPPHITIGAYYVYDFEYLQR